jgi:hypothetical protein
MACPRWPIVLAILFFASGCGTTSNSPLPAGTVPAQGAAPATDEAIPPPAAAGPPSHSTAAASRVATSASGEPAAEFLQVGGRQAPAITLPNSSTIEARPIDDARVMAAGIRKLDGEYMTLYSDLPPSPAVDRLVGEFDQAYPQWFDYFDMTLGANHSWHVTGCLMADRQRFAAAGLLPADLPPFEHGYFRGNRIWVYVQADDYYQRHLLLHEGTHAFMNALLGSCGPPWYSEGMAELLATHAVKDGHVALDYFPVDADEVPGWGRVRLVHDAIAAGRRLKFDDVLLYNARAHIEVEPYGWCWAAAAFLDRHPRYRDRFRELRSRVAAADFNGQLRERFASDWPELCEEWQLFAYHLEYGYDLEREAIDFRPGSPLAPGRMSVKVAADRGWQSTGVQLEAGKTYHLRAVGQCQVADDPRPWLSEPAGLTIRYWEGHPLGALLAAIHPEPFDTGSDSSLLTPLLIGAEATIQPAVTGTLYLRINDSPAELAENAGSVQVSIAAPLRAGGD